jgi:hypothetical protein
MDSNRGIADRMVGMIILGLVVVICAFVISEVARTETVGGNKRALEISTEYLSFADLLIGGIAVVIAALGLLAASQRGR